MTRLSTFCVAAALAGFALLTAAVHAEPVRTESGLVDGGAADGVRSYKGIPFARHRWAICAGDRRRRPHLGQA